MILRKSPFKKNRINIFIIIVLFLLGFSLLYFLYYRQRNQAEVYVGVLLNRSRELSYYSSYPANWLPYWYASAINIKDKDISTLGSLNAVVVDKEIYEDQSYGVNIYLLLRLNAIKDRSGIYLYKNKPLLIGTVIDFKLNKVQSDVNVIYVGSAPPVLTKSKLLVKLRINQIASLIAESINIGDEISDDKEEILMKIIEKKIFPASPLNLEYDSVTGQFLSGSDADNRNVDLTLEIYAEEIDNNYYFAKTQKIKAGEKIYLSFPRASLIGKITSVTPVK